MNEAGNIAVVAQVYAAAGTGDWAAVEALLADELVIHEADGVPYRGEYHGKDALRRLLGIVQATWDELSIVTDQVTAGGDLVIVAVRCAGRSRRTGEVFDMPLLEQWRVVEGKVVEIVPFYFDTAVLGRIG